LLQIARSAAFSPCGHYRWWLERVWEPQRPRLLFIGLNPSRADGRRDDATLRRLVGFAGSWGYGALEVLNLFSRISPSPAVLRRAADPVGADTDAWIRRQLAAHPQAPLWLGWGNQGAWRGRDRAVLALLDRWGASCRPVCCVGRTAAGQPRHPLYLSATLQPLPWRWPEPTRLGHPEDTFAGPATSSPCREPPVAMRFTCT
jgi:hypothetical protein